MHAQPAFARLVALLVMLALPIFAWAAEEQDSGPVGIVNKVENQAQVVFWSTEKIARAVATAALH